jgi:hypothetical protein
MVDALALMFVLLVSVAVAIGAARGLLGMLLTTMSFIAWRSEFHDAAAAEHPLTPFPVPPRLIAGRDVAALVAREAA